MLDHGRWPRNKAEASTQQIKPLVAPELRVKPATLQVLMRHRSIETTMKYYVDQDADDVADELWATHDAAQNGAIK